MKHGNVLELKDDEGTPSAGDETREYIKDLKKLEAVVLEKMTELKGTIEKANGQAEDAGSVAAETKAEIDTLSEALSGITDRLQTLEQSGIGGNGGEPGEKSVGEQFVESPQFEALQKSETSRARIEIKTAIINATGASQPLVPADRTAGIHATPERVLTVRDLLNTTPTSSNLVEFVRENVFTNSAGPQVGGSPEAFENVAKPESGITFTLQSQAVQTLAHWIPASKQVIDDSRQLQGYISGRLMYGLKLYEETQLLLGDNANGELNGIHTQATAYTVQSPQLTNELDIIREMIKQAHVSEYRPDAIILNPQDWYDIDVRKVGSSDDRYVVGNPREMSQPRLWGLPVVVTNSLTSGQAVVGAFGIGAEIYDREAASVEVSREHSDNFTKNMVTILAEERIALVVYRTEAFIKATV